MQAESSVEVVLRRGSCILNGMVRNDWGTAVVATEGGKMGKEASFEVFGKHFDIPFGFGGNTSKERILVEATILFALKGYASVSVRDIANKVQITPGALYNHFDSKEMLWEAILMQAELLYRLYFKAMDEELQKAESFGAVLDTIFFEPGQMKNQFTNYAFGLVLTERHRDKKAGELFNRLFLRYSVDFIRQWFDRCIAAGTARPFDTVTAARNIMHSVLIAIAVKIQEASGIEPPYDISDMFARLKKTILDQAV